MTSDTSEGRTIFIRNLSFDLSEKALYEFFSQFGPLEFAKIVKDPATRHSRGSAFVKFVNVDDATFVLEQSEKPENAHQFSLDNRTLNISIAVSRTEAQNLRKRKHEVDDPEELSVGPADAIKQKGRNLHLASIGIIRPGSLEAKGLSKEDLSKRDALLQEKKKKLTNPNYFISDVRLCLRNLPLHITDNDLKMACLKFLKNTTNHPILECRIMRNLQPGKQQYRSLGYGFVGLNNHENALSVLHGLNNNPNVFPPSNRRPIVEFSVENMKALQLRQKRAEKCLMLRSKTTESSSSWSPLNINRTNQKTNTVGISKKFKSDNNKLLAKKVHLSKTPHKSIVLPKHFGPKKRHRHRGQSSTLSAVASKPKYKQTRKQKRTAMKMKKNT
ncbi:unnamed protein product [Schistosoma turkestanicum]|nr:unnamed protein product [Schistosoma turkestanicum]